MTIDLSDPDTLNTIADQLTDRGADGVFPGALRAAAAEIRRLRDEAALSLVRVNTVAYKLGLSESESVEDATVRIHGALSRRASVCSDIGP